MKVSDGTLKDEVIIESAIAATYLADAYPSPSFWPESHSTPTSALTRARINFFVDTFVNKVNGSFYAVLLAQGEEQGKLGAEFVKAIEKELEPLLEGAAPFFGGSSRLTQALMLAVGHDSTIRPPLSDFHPGWTVPKVYAEGYGGAAQL